MLNNSDKKQGQLSVQILACRSLWNACRVSMALLAAAFLLGVLMPAQSAALAAKKQCIKERCKEPKRECIQAFATQHKTAKAACVNVGSKKEVRTCKKTQKRAFKQNKRACNAAYKKRCKICCAGEVTTACDVQVCGDNIQEVGEKCDGGDDVACPGACRADCTCRAPVQDPDVANYLLTLPPWDEFSPSKPDEDVEGDPLHEIDWDQNMTCLTSKCSITATPEDIVTYNPGSEVLYLGSLIQGKTYVGGLGVIEELPIRQRAPLTVSIDLHTPDSSRVVEHPTLATVSDAIHDLVTAAQKAGYTAGSSIFFNETSSQSLEQSMLKLGMSARYLTAKVRSQLEVNKTSTEHTLTAYFTQKMFTTSVVLPQTPASFFSPEFTKELLREQESYGRIGPDNLPVFVSNIVWGRMMTLTMTSKRDEREMKAALDASYNSVVTAGSVSVEAKHLETLQESRITLVAIGGDPNSAYDYIRTGQLAEFFKADAPLTSAVPISYTLRSLADNSIAKVSETTEYDVVDCSPLSVTLTESVPQWRQAVQDSGMQILGFDTNAANMYLALETQCRPLTSNCTLLGDELSFYSSATGYFFNFFFRNDACPCEVCSPPPFVLCLKTGLSWLAGDSIRIGTSEFPDADFTIEVEGSSVYAIGIMTHGHTFSSNESLAIYAADPTPQDPKASRMLRSFGYGDSNFPSGYWSWYFLGVVANAPLRSFSFNADSGTVNLYVQHLKFGVR